MNPIQANVNHEGSRFIATRHLWRRNHDATFWVSLSRGQAARPVPGGIVRLLTEELDQLVCFVDGSDNCLELLLRVKGQKMLIPTEELDKIRDLYRLDENPDIAPYTIEFTYVNWGIFYFVVRNTLSNEVKIDPTGDDWYFGNVVHPGVLEIIEDTYGIKYFDLIKDGDLGDCDSEWDSDCAIEREVLEEFVMPTTILATYCAVLTEEECGAAQVRVPEDFANVMLRAGKNRRWLVFVDPSDMPGPFMLSNRVHTSRLSERKRYTLAVGWKKITHHHGLKPGDGVRFEVRSVSDRVLIVKLFQRSPTNV
ncbi:hypothetical protein PIB30_085774 [Stylosanthes scabra]|uniref:TF-B3 domain-containing protein n=1 Tax=Stylosanthes scabra TaxID=79078 RepID=A0ABU6RU68_9FABA|nr:hypothetical protein [Stylosanthes scabra]